jgi:hypothetical protein
VHKSLKAATSGEAESSENDGISRVDKYHRFVKKELAVDAALLDESVHRPQAVLCASN